jgi:hypothetical protein
MVLILSLEILPTFFSLFLENELSGSYVIMLLLLTFPCNWSLHLRTNKSEQCSRQAKQVKGMPIVSPSRVLFLGFVVFSFIGFIDMFKLTRALTGNDAFIGTESERNMHTYV